MNVVNNDVHTHTKKNKTLVGFDSQCEFREPFSLVFGFPTNLSNCYALSVSILIFMDTIANILLYFII